MVDFDDDDLFEGLESEDEPESDFDVASVFRRIRKLEYKLEKQKTYKKEVELRLKQGVEKTESAIDSLKEMILKYMTKNKRSKLTFDDIGTISVVNLDKEDWIMPKTKEAEQELIDTLLEMDLESAFKEREYKLDKSNLRSILENNEHIAEELKDLVPWAKVDPHLSFRKK